MEGSANRAFLIDRLYSVEHGAPLGSFRSAGETLWAHQILHEQTAATWQLRGRHHEPAVQGGCLHVRGVTRFQTFTPGPGETSSSAEPIYHCLNVSWPAPHLWLTHKKRDTNTRGDEGWSGMLIDGMRDATGQMYMRNRSYDPQSGRFTQEDPIGIAGGLNVYGFAGGDPVNHSDPYGLTCVDWAQWASGECLDEIRRGLAAGIAAGAERARAIVRHVNHAAGTFAFLAVTEGTGEVVEAGAILEEAGFAQRTYSEAFSAEGTFSGRTIDEVAGALKSGELSTADVPIEYVEREGSRLIVNTRSAQALERAGVPRSQWRAVNQTHDAATQARVTRQLQRNRLTNAGTKTVTSSGK
jgi:RHS repeat-associated protein